MLCWLLILGAVAHATFTAPSLNFTDTKFLEAANRYRAFEATNEGCKAESSGPRVMLTGFGLFNGMPFNVSGAVIANLASSSFWPGPPPTAYRPRPGILRSPEQGARVINRILKIHGQEVNACLILADVIWDFSGAVIAREMERFQPDVVLLLGQSPQHAVLESGARNLTSSGPGFWSNGAPDPESAASASSILPDSPEVLPMTWDARALARRIGPEVRALGYVLDAPESPRAANTYICNEVSYLALAAARDEPLLLDQGSLVLLPRIVSRPRVGFMHLPALKRLDRRKLYGWSKILIDLIANILSQHG